MPQNQNLVVGEVYRNRGLGYQTDSGECIISARRIVPSATLTHQ